MIKNFKNQNYLNDLLDYVRIKNNTEREKYLLIKKNYYKNKVIIEMV
jgi:hypothetical protein